MKKFYIVPQETTDTTLKSICIEPFRCDSRVCQKDGQTNILVVVVTVVNVALNYAAWPKTIKYYGSSKRISEPYQVSTSQIMYGIFSA